MKIKGNNEIANYANKLAHTETKKPGDRTSSSAHGPTATKEGAVVDLSQRSKDVQKVQQAIQSKPDVRLDKIKVIKEKLEKGTYEIDFDGTAEKMLRSFLDETI